jgi:hypothetical protein
MTRRSEKDNIIAAENLSVAVVSTCTNRWRGPPSTPLLDPAETSGSNPSEATIEANLSRLMVATQEVWKNMTCRLTIRMAKLGF